MTLVVHELSANARKYGALSAEGGRVRIGWATLGKDRQLWLGFDWVEECGPEHDLLEASLSRQGFGCGLIEKRIPYELGGWGKITIEPHGARYRLEFPLKEGASILETDTPLLAGYLPSVYKTT